MPILSQEPTCFPETLLSPATRLWHEGDDPWWAVQTLPRQEKAFCRRLFKTEISYYCPTIANTYRSPSGRQRTSYTPLFAGYVFLCGGDDERLAALRTGCASRCLDVPDSAALESQLRQIYQLIAAGEPVVPESGFQPGARVRVKSGPLTGLEGSVFSRRGESRLLVYVNFVQQGASVELGEWDLERID